MSNETTVRKKRRRIPAFEWVNGIVLGIFALICLFPFVSQVLISFSSPADYMSAKFIVFPNNFNFESYKYILTQDRIGTAFGISVFTTICGLALNMTLTVILAYALSRKNMFGNRILFYFVLITMFFGGGLIPFYVVVKNLGFMNSLASIIVPFGINTFYAIILRNFFRRVPESVMESCLIDGAGQLRILVSFVLPLSKAGLATVALFYGVERWNDWYWPMLFVQNNDLFPLALELRNILSSNQSSGMNNGSYDPTLLFSQGQEAATVVISIIPIMVVYPFLQKYFVQGVMLGSVKG